MKNVLLVLAMAVAITMMCSTAYLAGHTAGVANALDWVRDQYGGEVPLPLEVAHEAAWR